MRQLLLFACFCLSLKAPAQNEAYEKKDIYHSCGETTAVPNTLPQKLQP